MRRKIRRGKYYLDLIRRRARDGGVPAARQLLEIGYLWVRNGIDPFYYFRAGFYLHGISWREKTEHVSGKRYLRMVRRINSEEWLFVAVNKIVTQAILQLFGIPTPPFYGFISASSGQTFDGMALRTSGDLAALVQRVGVGGMCFKPIGGWGGKGFVKVTFERGENTLAVARQPGGSRMAVDEFWNDILEGGKGPAYFCQGVVRQHPDVAAFHPSSVNTVRAWMYQPQPGKWEMFEALLRMGGDASSCVDNTSAGGVCARIDIQTGELGSVVEKKPEANANPCHPATGVRVDGIVLPMWEDAKKLCERTCRAFPYFRLLGLDIALGVDGPLVIEIECEPGAPHQIVFRHGAKGLLANLGKQGRFDWRKS